MVVYVEDRRPLRWVIETSDGKLWQVPQAHDGWARRRPYAGALTNLHMTDAPTARIFKFFVGAERQAASREAA